MGSARIVPLQNAARRPRAVFRSRHIDRVASQLFFPREVRSLVKHNVTQRDHGSGLRMVLRRDIANGRPQIIGPAGNLIAAQSCDRFRLAPRFSEVVGHRPVDLAEIVRASDLLQIHQSDRATVRSRQHARSRMKPRPALAVSITPQRFLRDRLDQRLVVGLCCRWPVRGRSEQQQNNQPQSSRQLRHHVVGYSRSKRSVVASRACYTSLPPARRITAGNMASEKWAGWSDTCPRKTAFTDGTDWGCPEALRSLPCSRQRIPCLRAGCFEYRAAGRCPVPSRPGSSSRAADPETGQSE